MSVVDPDNPPAELDLTQIATTAAEWMEFLEKGIEDVLEDGEPPPIVQTVAVVVELEWPPNASNNHNGSTAIHYRCTDGRKWFQKGLFLEIADAIARTQQPEVD